MTDDRQPTPRKVDATSLQGLAHPLRVQILDNLGHHGPATATQLAERLGESSGATSYHLRQLEKYGFIEEDPGRGSGRERWWRRVPGGIAISGHELMDSPATREATNLVINEFSRIKVARLDNWRNTYHLWPRAWQDASRESTYHLRLTAEELCEVTGELDRLLRSWSLRTGDRQGDGVVDVEVQTYALPVGDPPAEGDQPST